MIWRRGYLSGMKINPAEPMSFRKDASIVFNLQNKSALRDRRRLTRDEVTAAPQLIGCTASVG